MKISASQRKGLMIFALFLVANLVAHLAVVFSGDDTLLNWYLTDDAFYYFKTAQNITEGRGITYDGLAPTNGFHPLWMLVCVPVFALARFNLYLPLRALVLVQACMNAASGYLLYRLFSRHTSQAAGWLAAAVWMFAPAIHGITTKLGLETGINALALIFLIYRVSLLAEKEDGDGFPVWSRESAWIALAAVLALFSRLDNIFVLAMLGMWLVLRGRDMRWHTQVDWLLIFLSAVSAYTLRMQNSANQFLFLPFAYLLLAFSMALKPLFLFLFGVYRSEEQMPLRNVLLRSALAISLSSLLMAAAFFLLHDGLGVLSAYPRMALVYDWALSLALLVGVRVIRKLRDLCYGHAGQDLRFSANWRRWFGRGAAYFLPLFAALGIYMAFNRAYAGSAMPVSGQIKRWWGTLPNTIYGQPVRSLVDMFSALFSPASDDGPFWLITRPLFQAAAWLSRLFSLPVDQPGGAHVLMLVLVWGMALALVLVVLEIHGRQLTELADRFALLPLAVGGVMHALSYKATGYLHVRYWYWIAQMLLIVLFLALLAAVLLERLKKSEKVAPLLAKVSITVSLFIWLFFAYGLLAEFPPGGNVRKLYDMEGEQQFLAARTRPGDVIGMTGGGLIGYFMPERTILNLDGLINSAAYFELLKENRLEEYHRQVGTDFIYGDEQILLDSDPYRWTYTGRLSMAAQGPYYRLFKYCPDGCP